MLKSEVESEIEKLNFLPYRSDQIYKWLASGIKSFDDMTNIPKKEREILKEHFYIDNITIEKVLSSKKADRTKKYLLGNTRCS